MKNKKISVIIPTHNRTEKLRQCLVNLFKQNYANFEVIVFNDGGNEVTANNLLKNHSVEKISTKQMVIINNQLRIGHAAARNKSLKLASGDIIAFIDDDSIPAKNWLKSINQYFINHPSVTVVNGKIEAYSLSNSSERIRQGAYDYRHLLHSSGRNDNRYKAKYKLQTSEKNLADWLSLGNCAIQKKFIKAGADLFDESMKLNYGHKLGREFMNSGKIVTYSKDIVIKHHHARKVKEIIKTRIKNGINYSLIDRQEKKNYQKRLLETLSYLKYVLRNKKLHKSDKMLEFFYSYIFFLGYLFRKVKN